MDQKQLIETKKAVLLALTNAFSQEKLDEDYRQLSEELVTALAKKNPVPFLRGEIKNWAAGIIHALGMTNFLFDSSFEPYVKAEQIAEYFGVSSSTMGQKSKVIRDKFGMNQLGPSWKTKAMQEQWAPMKEMMVEVLGLPPDESLFQNMFAVPAEDDGFVDADHEIMMEYYDLLEEMSRLGPNAKIQKRLEGMIEEDPDFYDPYLVLREILQSKDKNAEADVLLETGSQCALKRITQKNGQWPEALEWQWLENRHIIRMLLNKALHDWTNGNTEQALDLLRKLLRSNPHDNIGARFYILAIHTGLDFDEYEKKFSSEFGYDAMKVERWFEKNTLRFPDEFDWWKEAVGYAK